MEEAFELISTGAWSIVPPLLALALALITKEVYSSLTIGVFVGMVIYQFTLNGVGIDQLVTAFTDVPNAMALQIADNGALLLFLALLGALTVVIATAGGSRAYAEWVSTHIKNARAAQVLTGLLGIIIFVDDYFNCLTVGAVMRPVTDEQKISRAKLSYIIDATAAPICMIAPISSWAAAVSATAADLDSGITGIQLFIQAIPYNFYSLLTIVFVIVIVVMGFDYGPMARAEIEAYRDGMLGSLGNEEKLDNPRAKLIDMLIPILVLIVCCIVGMMFVGGFWDPEAEGFGDLALAFGNTDASVGLPWGSIIALVFTFIYLLCRRVITFGDAAVCIVDGFKAMVPALLILTFALTLKLATSALGADVFVAGLMEGAAAGLYSMLPAIIFLVALGLAFATGTSWGTFGILIPIVLPIFTGQPELLTIGISACLAGAVCGDHCSPISDTTIMASAGANVNHIVHVQTQLPYVLTVAAISFVCFVIAGFVQNWIICLAIGIVLVVGALLVLRKTIGKRVTK